MSVACCGELELFIDGFLKAPSRQLQFHASAQSNTQRNQKFEFPISLSFTFNSISSANLSKASGIMESGVGLLVLFLLGASWACDARQLGQPDLTVMEISKHEQERDAPALENDNVCTLCEEFAAKAVDYLAENKTQTEIIDSLHMTCSRLASFKQQCITLVDYYAPLFFLEISTIQPADFCRKVNLCEKVVIISSQLREDSCGLCHHAVSEILVKLKDPDTQLEILELLLKGCNSMQNYVKKCKKMVFEYGPLILANAEQFLETTDVCTILHACDSPTAGHSDQAAKVVNVLADS